MKKLFFVLAIAAISTSVNAQSKSEAKDVKPLTFSVGADVQMPMGTFGDFYSVGFGGSAQGRYAIGDNAGITLSAGYLTFSGKSVTYPYIGTIKNPSLGLIPILAGVEYNFTPMFFGSAQLGMSLASGSGSGSNFTYAPGVGGKFGPVSVLVKYTGMSASGGGGSLGSVGARVAYNF